MDDNQDYKKSKLTPYIKGNELDDAGLLRKGISKLSNILSSNKLNKNFGKGISSLLSSGLNLQKSAVIVRYENNKNQGQWRSHGNYLARENSQELGEKALGFNQKRDDIDIGAVCGKWQEEGDPRLWKIIISPEFGELIDLKEHTRLVVSQMEADLKTKLLWVAVDHYNTDNPHVHLLIRGIDNNGQSLEIDPGYLKSGIRQRSQEVATNQLGYRTESHASLSREKQIKSDRFTSLDKAIFNEAKDIGDGRLIFSMDDKIPSSDFAKQYRIQLIERLKKLESMGVARRIGNKEWQLGQNLKEQLQEIGKIRAGLKILERHKKHMTTHNLQLVYTTLEKPGDKVIGRILGAGLDPHTDKPYLLIEGIDGKAHYVTQSKKTQAERLKSDLVDGHLAKMEVKAFEKDGKIIEYLDTKDYGKINEHLPVRLLDEVIATGIINHNNIFYNVSINDGFAGKFLSNLSQRLELYKQNEIIFEKDEKHVFGDKYQNLANYLPKDAYKILGKLVTIEGIAKANNVQIEKATEVETASYIGPVMGIAYDDIEKKKYVIISTGGSAKAFPLPKQSNINEIKIKQMAIISNDKEKGIEIICKKQDLNNEIKR